MRSTALATTLASLLLVGCSSAPAHKELEPSGFLKNWDELEPIPDPERKGALRYMKPGLDLSKYDSVYVTPPSVLVDPEKVGIKPEEVTGIADDLVLSLHRALGTDYQLVERPGPRSIVLRIAITDLEKAGGLNQAMRVLTGPGQDQMGADPKYETRSIQVEGMGIEAELLDPETHERLIALAEYESATHLRSSRNQTWGSIQSALDFWASRLREALDQAHARKASEVPG